MYYFYAFDKVHKPLHFISLKDKPQQKIFLLSSVTYDNKKNTFGSWNFEANSDHLNSDYDQHQNKYSCYQHMCLHYRLRYDNNDSREEYKKARSKVFSLNSSFFKRCINGIFFPWFTSKDIFVFNVKKNDTIRDENLLYHFFKSNLNNIYLVCSPDQITNLCSQSYYDSWQDVIKKLNFDI